MTSTKITVFLCAILVPMAVISVALHAKEHTRQKRGLVNCAFFQQAGFGCRSCFEVQACLPFNIGIARTCGSETPYCVDGTCSKTKGAWCSTTTTRPTSPSKSKSTTSSSSSDTESTTSSSSSDTESTTSTSSSDTESTTSSSSSDTESTTSSSAITDFECDFE